MTKSSKNKFDELNRDELLRRCLEQEDELAKLRPAPARFKLGQVLHYNGIYFVVLSLENRMGQWHYGYQKGQGLNTGLFRTYPEGKCRSLTLTEIDGSPATTSLQATEASSEPVVVVATPPTATTPGSGPGHNFPDYQFIAHPEDW